MNKLIVGLTGGIASGKSTAAREFSRLDCGVIDADEISRELTGFDAQTRAELLDAFPEVFFNGVINRFELRKLVFDDYAALKKLNAIMHPKILYILKTLAAESEKSIVVAVVPLLFETGFDKETDISVAVTASEQTRIQRLMKRDNITVKDALKIINSQMDESERQRRADYCISSDDGEESLFRQIRELIKLFRERLKAEHITRKS